MGERVTPVVDGADGAALGRARLSRTADGLVIEAPGPRVRAIPLAAALYGVPWFAAVVALGVWYLGWGPVPDGFWMRLLLFVLALALTQNLSTLAYITIWNAFYEHIGTETLTIDPQYIVVVRRAGRFKREHRIGRKIIETAEVLPLHVRRPGRSRIELKSWRATIGFGGGLDEPEADACARVIQELFDRDEAARHAAEVARGAAHAAGGHSVEPPTDEEQQPAPEESRASVMRAYRQAIESRGPIKSRLAAIAAVAKGTSRRGRGQAR